MNIPSYAYREVTGEYGYDEHFQAPLWTVDDNDVNHYGKVEGEQANANIVLEGTTEIMVDIAAGKAVDGLVTGGKILLKRLKNVPTTGTGSIDDLVEVSVTKSDLEKVCWDGAI